MKLNNRLEPANDSSSVSISDNRSIITFDFHEKRSIEEHAHSQIELIYLLKGEMNMKLRNEVFTLHDDDFLIINANVSHSLVSESAVIYAVIHINYHKLSNRLGDIPLKFQLNTALRENSETNDIRYILKKIMFRHQNLEGGAVLYRESLYYLLLNSLVGNFMIKVDDESSLDYGRLLKIKNFIYLHFNEPISLNQLANLLHFSPSYMSKYFKKHIGMNFLEYLTEVRLINSLIDLKKSIHSITRIAMDNGFANSNAFLNAFKKKYQMTPLEFKNNHKKNLYLDNNFIDAPNIENVKNSLSKNFIKSDEALSKKVDKIIRNYKDSNTNMTTTRIETVEICADTTQHHYHQKNQLKLINIGRVNVLTDLSMREQLLDMKKNLGVKYVRFWDIYDLISLYFNENAPSKYYFSRLDRIFDFLVENELKPFIELGFKPQLLLKFIDGGHQYMLTKQKDILFNTPSEYEEFLRSFVIHYQNRYSLEEVEKWCFEQWIDPRQKDGYILSLYFEMFDAANKAIKSVSPNINLGGGGISYANDDYRLYFKTWHEHNIHPDYFSIYCYPYTTVLSGRVLASIKKQVDTLKEVATIEGFENIPFIITEWSFAVSDRNPLNDSCFKAAYIMHTILSSKSLEEMLGYWHGSDLLSEYIDTNQIIHGGNGLVSIDNIKKPAYYAFYFLRKLGKYCLYTDDNCYITTNDHKNFSLVCWNYKKLNSDYIIKTDDNISIDDLSKYYEDTEDKNLHIRITNVDNSTYKITIYSISENNGSIHNEWKKMCYIENMNKEEIEYLRSVCIPKITMQIIETTNNMIDFVTTLTPQEIQYIHITLQ